MAGVQTSIYIFEAHKPHDFEKTVKFIDFRNDGYKRTRRALQELDEPSKRYADIVKIYKAGKNAKIEADWKLNEVYVEDFISNSGTDWNFDQHKLIDTKPTFNDFRKTVADYLAWEVSQLLKEDTYFAATGLKDYKLTHAEQAALDRLDSVAWGTFKIEDVLVWQRNISELNPLHLDSLTVSEEKKYPFYGQATTNNGIIEYRHLKDEVLNNKLGKATILIHSNNQNTVFLDTPFYLKDGHGATSVLQSEHLNKITAQFFMASIKKVILQKYTYNSKATKIELKNSDINLPVKSDNTPNYEYMTLVISAMQKVVIKKVVDYLDLRIEKLA
jgi:hypothetical protein